MSPKIVDIDEKKKEILSAALKVISEKGLARTRIEDISEKAGIGKGTIYEYFESKEDLGREAFMYLMNVSMADFFFSLDEHESALDDLKTIFNKLRNIHMKELSNDFYKVVIDFLVYSLADEEKRWVVDIQSNYQEYIGFIKSIVEKGIKKGEFRKVDPELVSYCISAVYDGLLMQWFVNMENFDVNKAINSFENIFLNGLVARKN